PPSFGQSPKGIHRAQEGRPEIDNLVHARVLLRILDIDAADDPAHAVSENVELSVWSEASIHELLEPNRVIEIAQAPVITKNKEVLVQRESKFARHCFAQRRICLDGVERSKDLDILYYAAGLDLPRSKFKLYKISERCRGSPENVGIILIRAEFRSQDARH